MSSSSLNDTTDPEDNKLNNAILQCQLAGRRGDFDTVVGVCDAALSMLDKDEMENNKEPKNRSILTKRASLNGYKGFALTKQSKYNDAITLLEKSLSIRRELNSLSSSRKQKSKGEFPAINRRERHEIIATERSLAYCYRVTGKQAPLPPLVKFPRTPHLFDSGGAAVTSDDLVVSGRDVSAIQSVCDGQTRVVIEEKVDGANLGFSLSLSGQILVQNRSHYISSNEHQQFSLLYEWIEQHREGIIRILEERPMNTILFGEWVVARHSLPYERLPSYFIAFDIYDKEREQFLTRQRFHNAMKGTGIPVVPVVAVRTFGPYTERCKGKIPEELKSELNALLDTKSAFRNDDGTLEGIVLRVDSTDSTNSTSKCVTTPYVGDKSDKPSSSFTCNTNGLLQKWKVVRPDFISGCQDGHWSRRKIDKQVVDYTFVDEYMAKCYVFADSSASSTTEVDLKVSDDSKEKSKNLSKSTQKDPRTFSQREHDSQNARKRRRIPRCILLCGLPGAGKSTFASQIDKFFPSSSPSGCTIVNQDKMGRKECVRVAGSASRKNRIIVDRCNLTESERSEWYHILHSPPRGEIALVYFAADADTCVERVKGRINHETIPHGLGERIVRSLVEQVQPPSEKEINDLFGVVETVHSFEESNALLCRWGCV